LRSPNAKKQAEWNSLDARPKNLFKSECWRRAGRGPWAGAVREVRAKYETREREEVGVEGGINTYNVQRWVTMNGGRQGGAWRWEEEV